MKHFIIQNEDGDSIGIEQNCLVQQVVSLGLSDYKTCQQAVRQLAVCAAKLLLAAEQLKKDKTNQDKQHAYIAAERALADMVQPILQQAQILSSKTVQ